METEVAVEKNQRSKLFGFSPTNSQDVDDGSVADIGDLFKANKENESSTPGPALAHKLPQMLKAAVIGESTVGKTAICEAFCNQNFTPASKYSMTCGVQIYGKCLSSSGSNRRDGRGDSGKGGGMKSGEEKVNLILLDSAGRDLYREYLPKYWDKLDSVILVMDLTSEAALETGQGWLNFIQNSLNSVTHGRKAGILIGNKNDLKEQRVITFEASKAFAAQNNLEYFECSVRNNSGLEEPFQFLAQEWFDANQAGRESSSMFKGQGGGEHRHPRKF